ncbi:acyl-CoA dehydrogenase family protein [Castellaniella caeni]|uniref:acyl-CoA dehydrogenase family protein n=1 Tax=Castellaniella caeni TaxID=266123 RepID=UPI000834EFB4|nr:acyl-CoA dehydrogenase family protein [Castellaniella caeni]
MNFEHTEDRRMMAESLGRYLREQYPFAERDTIARSAAGRSPEHWQRMAQMGIVGALFGEHQGGYGGAGFDLAVVFEELGRRLVTEPFLGTLMAGLALSEAAGNAGQARVQAMIDGQCIGAFAHAEPDAAYALARVSTTARRTEGGWVLDGAKAVVPHAEAADLLVVSARTSGAPADEQGISLFVVSAKAVGLALRGYPLVDGGRAAELVLTNVRLGDEALLGAVDQAYPLIERIVGAGVLALCAESLGAMEVAKDDTLEYLRTRQQFGVPIGSFQALQHRMVDVLLEIEQARSAVIRAAAALDGDDRLAREQALSAAKYTIGRVGILVAEEAIQLHGGIGMTWELPLAHYAKRLVMIDHQLGDEDFHLQRYMALGGARS